MPWYTSWIPSLPNFDFAIPTSIQARFLSFILKKTLGNFVKPGQLDHHQIDSQIGSGYVQVNDLELHPEAINAYLEGLPVVLHSGTVSAVKARIPWPNPLASTLGFSLKSLHLVFYVVDTVPPNSSRDMDMSSSVVSVAESFIHEELTEREEVNLWKSMHEEATSNSSTIDDQVLPGGLWSASAQAEHIPKSDSDPAGVSVFAGLIERLLARFEFDVQDIRITLVHPMNMEVSINLEEFRYSTNDVTPSLPDHRDGESRSLSVTGLVVSCRNLSPDGAPILDPKCNILSPIEDIRTSLPRISSQSSMDERTEDDMTRSIFTMPERSGSPAESLSSSMYASAISTTSSLQSSSHAQTDSACPVESRPDGSAYIPQQISNTAETVRAMDGRLLAFGSHPIVFRLKTPSPTAAVSEEDSPFLSSAEPADAPEDELRASVSVGIVACIIRPWQIRGLSRLATSLDPGPARAENIQPNRLPTIKVNAKIRGAVLLFLSSASDDEVTNRQAIVNFFDKPLVPPALTRSYTRVYLDTMSAEYTIASETNGRAPHLDKGAEVTIVNSLDANLTDLSIFYFHRDSSLQTHESEGLLAFPIVITDPHILSQYPNGDLYPNSEDSHQRLPTFPIVDWTDDKCKSYGTRLSQWRYPPPKDGISRTAQATRTIFNPISFPPNVPPCIRFVMSRKEYLKGSSTSRITQDLETTVIPLNIRIDIQYLLQPGGLLDFCEELMHFETVSNDSDRNSVSSEETVDMYASTRNIRARKRNVNKSVFPGKGLNPEEIADNAERITVHHTVNFAFIRIAVRCPPPHSIDRTGALILDIHGLNMYTDPKSASKGVKFVSGDITPPSNMRPFEDKASFIVEFDRAVFATSMVKSNIATTFMSVGSLTDEEPQGGNDTSPSPTSHIALKPRIYVLRPYASGSRKAPKLALSIDIPAICIDISKPSFDALQYWADDLSQLLDRLSKPPESNKASSVAGDSREASLIGSRFFANSRSGSGSLTPTESAESVIKLNVTEAFIKIMVPRNDCEPSEIRPLDLKASDLDVLLEVNPDDKQHTVITVGVMDLTVKNTGRQGRIQKFFGLSCPHSLSSTPVPIVKLRFTTSTTPGINSKETRIKLTLCNFTYTFFPELQWISDITLFVKNPPGTFESVIPSDRTRIFVKILDGSIQALAPSNLASIVSHIDELEFSTDVVGESRHSSFQVQATDLSLLVTDDVSAQTSVAGAYRGRNMWAASGYALLSEVKSLNMDVIDQLNSLPERKVAIHHIVLRLHLCADTLTTVSSFAEDFGTLFKSSQEAPPSAKKAPAVFNKKPVKEGRTLMSSIEDLAFKAMPEIGPAPDMIYDDLPTNMDYLDESFGAAAGLRELCDDDLEDFDDEDSQALENDPNIVSKVGGETIKVFEPHGLEVLEEYFHSIPPDNSQGSSHDTTPLFNVKIREGNFTLFLYDGYDWVKTRRTIEEEVREMRKRLAKIRQLVATGQVQDPAMEDTSAVLFNSVRIGLDQDDDVLREPSVLIAAIDEELKDDYDDTASQSSWQSLRPTVPSKPKTRSTRIHGKKLTRSKAPSMEFCLMGVNADFDQYDPQDALVSRTFVTVKDLEILDHIKTSTWKKFLTELRSDSRGNVRETGSNMVRVELRNVRPVSGNSSQEARLRAKILPLRLYVDQDAVDFLKKFFSFKDPNAQPSSDSAEANEAYIQSAEIFPIDLKLDYKPRRVDYRALKEGRTIELMNFFHFDGAEMTLRHITLSGVTGWSKMFEMLNDLWTPDVKATQLAEVISGVAPIRSVVNVGSGVADLILLPIAQYKKDGRIVRGVQKGATAFVKSTAIEAIKMGAKLATGTQVILEHAEGILGGQSDTITAEPVQISSGQALDFDEENDEDDADLISKYAQQPADLREGVQSAYKSLQRNLSSAAQTILAVPMEVYERSGNEGPVRSVIRAVPIAVLKPMIGASEAVSKTLLGLHNTLDPNVRHDNDAKYKLRD
ncbi:hypothetical protein D9613_003111 [Agrocybe pediades]|uniref:Autophagy-related protein 2 n=1 Tax=Agrocybe pediades TaxID=84607 RepID=A0A8H4QPV5_9AGAR|nr:hypothetical protein D9613_003111 [Agrocybe pediades]